jgi:hypothetical protein
METLQKITYENTMLTITLTNNWRMKKQVLLNMAQEAYLMVHCVTWYLRTAHEWALVLVWELLFWLPCCVVDTTDFLSSAPGVGGASFLGGILSLMASSPFASANDVILWFGEKPCRAVNAKGVHCTLQYSQSRTSTVQTILFSSQKLLSKWKKKKSLHFALPYTCTIPSQRNRDMYKTPAFSNTTFHEFTVLTSESFGIKYKDYESSQQWWQRFKSCAM